jgi:hypothetical protein
LSNALGETYARLFIVSTSKLHISSICTFFTPNEVIISVKMPDVKKKKKKTRQRKIRRKKKEGNQTQKHTRYQETVPAENDHSSEVGKERERERERARRRREREREARRVLDDQKLENIIQ